MTAWRMAAAGLILSLAPLARADQSLEPGDTMPLGDVKMESVDGRRVSLHEVAGKVGTLAVFTCNHCPFVQDWESRMTAIGHAAMKLGIGVIFINSNDPEAYPTDSFEHMKKQAQASGYEFPYVVDATSDLARAFGARRTPEAFVFDAQHRLVYRGTIDDNAQNRENVGRWYLQDALNDLLLGQEVKLKKTGSLGSRIKLRPPAQK